MDGEKVVAVTTRINDYPSWYGERPVPVSRSKATVFGYPIPENVCAVDHSFSVADDSVRIGWTNEKFAMVERQWHYMEICMPVTEEKILALLVAMKLTC